MVTRKFWKDALERAVKTVAQAAGAVLVVSGTVQEVDWSVVGGTAALAGLLSILTSLGFSGAGEPESGSAVKR